MRYGYFSFASCEARSHPTIKKLGWRACSSHKLEHNANEWFSVLCMRSKAWLAAPGLLAHAEVTENIVFVIMGPKLRHPAEKKCTHLT